MLLILAREPIHSALALILVMISLAVLYLLLGAEFIAAVQIIVYAGAIMVLVRLRHHAAERGRRRAHQFQQDREIRGRAAGFLPAARNRALAGALSIGARLPMVRARPPTEASTRELSEMLFRQYLFPFEATSILILIAILGALVLARKDMTSERSFPFPTTWC